MGWTLLGYAVACFVLAVHASPVVDNGDDRKGFRYEEYQIEHEVSSAQAKNSAQAIDLSRVQAPPGCQKCNQAEITYCLGRDLINDHCCCDRRYHEVFPFIPHTCYWGTTQCKPLVDCAEYDRLRRCCCNRYALQKWKEKSSAHIVKDRIYHIALLLLLYFIL